MENKTIITKEIDGFNIILGFGELVIDPEATKKAINPRLPETDEYKAVQKISAEMGRLSSNRQDLIKSAKEAFRNQDKSKHAKICYEIELRDEQIKEVQKKLIDACKVLNNKRIEIWKENLVYFEPKAGEKSISEKEYKSLSEKMLKTESEGKKVVFDITGKEIVNNKGVKYIKNGKVIIIERLGEEPDGPLQKDVTPEEFEQMRMESLTDTERKTEYEAIKAGLLSQATQMRSGLEIEGDKKALEKSQDWYNQKLNEIKQKYGITD
jgi:hypothetical protein